MFIMNGFIKINAYLSSFKLFSNITYELNLPVVLLKLMKYFNYCMTETNTTSRNLPLGWYQYCVKLFQNCFDKFFLSLDTSINVIIYNYRRNIKVKVRLIVSVIWFLKCFLHKVKDILWSTITWKSVAINVPCYVSWYGQWSHKYIHTNR